MRGLFLLLAPSLVACQSLTGLSDLEFGEGPAQAGAGGAGQGGEAGGTDAGAGGSDAGQGGAGGAGQGGAGQGGAGNAGAAGQPAGSGGAGGAGGAGQAGAAGAPPCTDKNQPPQVVVAGMVEGVAGQELELDASKSADPEGGALVFTWEPLGGAPALIEAKKAIGKVTLPECGSYSYRVKATDACGASAEGVVTVNVATGGYVASAGCDPAKACGGLSKPWCDLQAAVDGTKGKVTLRVAAGSYGEVTLRDGVTIEGGYAAGFGSRLAAPSPQGTVIALKGASAVRGPEQGSAALDGVLVAPQLTAPQSEVVAILMRGQGGLTLRNTATAGGPPGAEVSLACAVKRGVDGGGALSIEAGSSLVALDASTSSAALCLAGAGAVSLSGAEARGGAASESFGVDAVFLGPLTADGAQIVGGFAAVRSAGLRWSRSTPSPEAKVALKNSTVQGGKGKTTAGVELVRVGLMTAEGGEIRGESGDGPGGDSGVGVQATQVGDGAAFGVELDGVQVVGAASADQRVGVLAKDTSLRVTHGSIDGSQLPGGSKAIGVRVEGLDALASGVSIVDTARVAGGAPEGKYEAFGVEIQSPSPLSMSGNALVIGCSPSCKASGEGATAAGVRLSQGVHKIEKNSVILGGPQKDGPQAVSSRHHGVLVEYGCPSPGCVTLDALDNAMIAGNNAAGQLPGEAYGLSAVKATVRVDRSKLVGGHADLIAAGLNASGCAGSKVTASTLGGGDAELGVGLVSKSSPGLRVSGNFIDACGISGSDGKADSTCFLVNQSVGVQSRNDLESTWTNNYVLGGFGLSAVACDVGNDGTPGGENLKLLYNLCLAQGRKGAGTSATGLRLSGLDGKIARGFSLLDNIFMAADRAETRLGGSESSVEKVSMQYNDFFVLSGVASPSAVLYRREGVDLDDSASINQSSSGDTYNKNFSKYPEFDDTSILDPASTLGGLTAQGLHLGPSCALRNTGLSTAENLDFDGEPRGTGAGGNDPEVGPDECP